MCVWGKVNIIGIVYRISPGAESRADRGILQIQEFVIHIYEIDTRSNPHLLGSPVVWIPEVFRHHGLSVLPRNVDRLVVAALRELSATPTRRRFCSSVSTLLMTVIHDILSASILTTGPIPSKGTFSLL
jgi:hypothetical protein